MNDVYDGFTIEPADENNMALLANVHPPRWKNPVPAARYNMVVIGAGTAGLVTAAGAAGLGARVALVERRLMGGDCLNFGCIPSKSLIRSARLMAELGRSRSYGIAPANGIRADFPSVMQRVRRIRAEISSHDSVRRFQEALGVDVFIGEARFTGLDTVMVGDSVLRFKKAAITTGARPVSPPIPGLAEAGFLTNESVFSLTKLPARLLVIGGGPIGCELSQAFARLGADVTIIARGPRFLPREDPEAATLLEEVLRREGIRIFLGAAVKAVGLSRGGKTIEMEVGGKSMTVEGDEILVGAGRAPNVEGLNLEEAGITYDRKGIRVDDFLRTTNSRVYAAGDVCSPYKFTHLADFMARIVIQNALFWGRRRFSSLVIPWCTYTSPEIAHVGMYESEAGEKGIEVTTLKRELKDVDRAVTDGETEGFVKVHLRKGTDRILGATVVAEHAGEMITEFTLAMANKIGLGKMAKAIHPYPTQAESIRQLGDMFNRNRLTPGIKALFKKWFQWTA